MHQVITEAPECCPAGKASARITLPSLASLLLLAPRLVSAGVSGAAEVVRKTLDGSYNDECPDCDDIPEGHCPDTCVCRIHWAGCPGDSFKYRVQVTNTSKTSREFTLKSLPFPHTGESVDVVPDKKTLARDESLNTVVSFSIPDSFTAGRYESCIRVTGAYEQIIQVFLTVHPKQACSCHIEQGDIPKRIKAHHWYHHFQCVEDCFEPAKKAG